MPRRVKQNQPSTHYQPDWHTKKNFANLRQMDRFITHSMGGPLAEQADPGVFRHVLDVGSGSGNWAIEAALLYPEMSLVGIDIDAYLVHSAQTDAEAAQVEKRVEFRTMDALKPLDIDRASFDLVNIRFGGGFMRTWDWPNFLQECSRIIRPEGVLRIAELEMVNKSSSAALVEIGQLIGKAFFASGHFFDPDPTGLITHLENLLQFHGYQNIQIKKAPIQLETKSEKGPTLHETTLQHLQRVRPFVQKWCGSESEGYDRLYQQVVYDMQHQDNFYMQEDFFVIWGHRDTW